MKTAFILLLIFLSYPLHSAFAQQTISVPHGDTPVLIDGEFSAGEWQKAFVTSITDSVSLYLKRNKGHIFIGVRIKKVFPFYVDVYLLTSDKKLYNLHASRQIGERLLTGNSWTESDPAWCFGNNMDWIANEAKIDPTWNFNLPIVERFYPYEGYEFQIRRSRFKGGKWRLRIVVRNFGERLSDIIFPADSKKTGTSQWIILNLK